MENHIYYERISSAKTGVLFVSLTLLFITLTLWRVMASGFDLWAVVLPALFCFFMFYALNYRTLVIRLTAEMLELRFGIFRWTIATDNIESCFLDTTSLWRIGGAGIHFTFIQKRYRAMFNFLEYPRVVVRLKRKQGPVRDLVFSTRHPETVLDRIQTASSRAHKPGNESPAHESLMI